MNFDFSRLDWHQFDRLVGSLLAAEGFRDLQSSSGKDGGVDWAFSSPDGKRWAAQVKFTRQPTLSSAVAHSAILDLKNAISNYGAEKALLVISIPQPPAVREATAQVGIDLTVWDGNTLNHLLAKHSAVRASLQHLLAADAELEQFIKSSGGEKTQLQAQASKFIDRLEVIPAGTEGWRQYEDICIDMLTFAFSPRLRVPRIQSRTEDGLDRRDAIYPIAGGNPFWDSIKYQHSARMVVAEFKNYGEKIGQTEVESLQQYLLPKAKRSFGLLCSRHGPSESALKARRRAWMIAENIILFLTDEDLKALVQNRADDIDPSFILGTQMDDFFITLAP